MRVRAHRSKKKAKKTKKGDEEEPEAIDVLVDIILSLLAQPSALLRDVVEHTFKAISGQVSKEGIQDMLLIVIDRSRRRRRGSGG